MSNSYVLQYSPAARDDLRKIYMYIAFDLMASENAEGQVKRIRNEIRSLNFMPSRYEIVDWEPWKSMRMRKVPVDNFVIYYTVNDDTRTVTIIRIFYGGRNIKDIINTEFGTF